MTRIWFTLVLVISIVIFVPQILARPQQYQLKEIRARYSNESHSYPNYTGNRGQGTFTRSTSASLLNPIRRSRRSEPVNTWDFHYTFGPGIDVVYRLHTVAETWAKAREICQEEDGHLAVINSPDESQAIGDVVAARTYPHYDSADPDYVLIGFHNNLLPRSDLGHRTIDGRTLEQAGFAGWKRDEPNNGGILLGNEDCGSIFADGKLNDVFCDKKYAFICELPLRNEIVSIGPAGPQGAPGINGEAGIPGPAGRVGEQGEPGEKATNGPQGVAGERGSKGDTGSTGPMGPTGDKGDKGKMGPQGSRGPVGPKGSGGSNGPKGRAGRRPGSPGSKGEKGSLGEEGDAAPKGFAGEKGFKGNAGSPGLVGPKGQKGDKGRAGPMSPPGPVGPKGSRGQAGIDGIAGPRGPAGLDGRKGETGGKGTDGQGVKGDKGSRGAAGPPGPQGFTGSTGPTGDRGPFGPSGPRGDPGLPEDIECLTLLLSLGHSRGYGLIDGGERPIFPRNHTLRKKCEEFIVRVYEQIGGASSFRNHVQPDGSEESPARTCKDLFIAYPDKPNGVYWIDPNGGDVADAISVNCYVKNRRTCIRPSKTSREDPMSHISDQREVWLSELKNETQITYTADANQINALQLLSNHAEQSLIYRCLKSVGYYDAEGRTYDRGLKLLTWNKFTLEPYGSPHFRYEIVSDGCRDRLDEWKETEIAYRTDRPVRLPVIDVRLRDVGEPDQRFAVEIGEVCFT